MRGQGFSSSNITSCCRKILWTIVLLISFAGNGKDHQCEAKSWANIVADTPAAVVDQSCRATTGVPRKSASSTNTAANTKHTTTTAQQQQQHSRREPHPGLHKSLPSNAEKHQLRNVYDGDTLFLADGRGVRFLGIDTPEIAEKQAYAQEAKKYVKDLCPKRSDIYLSFEGDREDKYGRILAFVWVAVDGGYLCINEGIVAAGLAKVYLPTKDAKLTNLKKLIALQKKARKARRGLWSDYKDYNVVATPNGAAFHLPGCRHLSRSRNLKNLKASDAADKGLHPCRTCLADA